MKLLGHSSCRRGKRVRVVLKDGTVIIDKFVDSTDRYVLLEQHGRVRKAAMKSFTILKLRPR